MNRNKRRKHRNPENSPFVIQYRSLATEKERAAYLLTLNRNQIKKLNRV